MTVEALAEQLTQVIGENASFEGGSDGKGCIEG
jgi:hypothetical protein